MEARNPVISTYRIQFSPAFTFRDAGGISTYLAELGISHLYASPIMEAIPGSVHGYDMTDFSRIREELGGETDFNALNSRLKDNGIGWIQDFVPNHMAMDTRNPYLRDILEKGRLSEFSRFFDIYWNHQAFQEGKICFPILHRPYYLELTGDNFSFGIENGLVLRYRNINIPLDPISYGKLLGRDLSTMALNFYSGKYRFNYGGTNPSMKVDKNELEGKISEKLAESVNDRKLIDDVISMQNYSLRHWTSTAYEINYRRFFAVNKLICLREEDSEVFGEVHQKLLSLVSSLKIDGIRIDHVDGLFNPGKYLNKLRNLTGNVYIVVEKILEKEELLNGKWPVQGTTGYDFLGIVASVMCSPSGFHSLDTFYRKFVGEDFERGVTLYYLKLETMDRLFPGVLEIVANEFWKSMRRRPYGRDLTFQGMKNALREILAHSPIYRTYLPDEPSPASQIAILNSSIADARESKKGFSEYFDAFELFINSYARDRDALRAIQVMQQYMPAVYAKPIEDRLFYIFNRLISLNDVGINPFDEPVSPEGFHEFNKSRLKRNPTTMNTVSTHDTKVSEDVRARIDVLSEIPEELEKYVQEWHNINSALLAITNGKECPSRNEEYYAYQLLLGSYPVHKEELEKYGERILGHLVKSIREAGINTSWDEPDPAYEAQYSSFMNSLLDASINQRFIESFGKLQKVVSFHGFLNSISQKILQLTVPGVPDIYQGTEVWNFNLVDPDNRRKVDFQRLVDLQHTVRREFQRDHGVIASYLDKPGDGKIKMLVTTVLLTLRREMPEVFLYGSYIPIYADGPRKGNLVAFARSYEEKSVIVVVPRLTVSLGKMKLPLGNETWSGNSIKIPVGISGDFENVFTGRVHSLQPGVIVQMEDLLEQTPFSVLVLK